MKIDEFYDRKKIEEAFNWKKLNPLTDWGTAAVQSWFSSAKTGDIYEKNFFVDSFYGQAEENLKLAIKTGLVNPSIKGQQATAAPALSSQQATTAPSGQQATTAPSGQQATAAPAPSGQQATTAPSNQSTPFTKPTTFTQPTSTQQAPASGLNIPRNARERFMAQRAQGALRNRVVKEQVGRSISDHLKLFFLSSLKVNETKLDPAVRKQLDVLCDEIQSTYPKYGPSLKKLAQFAYVVSKTDPDTKLAPSIASKLAQASGGGTQSQAQAATGVTQSQAQSSFDKRRVTAILKILNSMSPEQKKDIGTFMQQTLKTKTSAGTTP